LTAGFSARYAPKSTRISQENEHEHRFPNKERIISREISRRSFLGGCAATAALAQATPVLTWAAEPRGAAQRVFPLNRDWRFGGKFSPAAVSPEFDDRGFTTVTLPHSVTPLSWQGWNPDSWQDVWIYRRHFSVPADLKDLRLFLHFERVMAGAIPVVNGHSLEPHLGGFLPFDREITGLVQESGNVLALQVDSRWTNCPPSGSPRGPKSVDYLLPGGINGQVELRAVPQIFLREVFAKPVNVLQPDRYVDITCRIDSGSHTETRTNAKVRLTAILRQAGRTVATTTHDAQLEKPDQEIQFTLSNLGNVQLWDVDHPHLCELEITLEADDRPLHRYTTRFGLREVRFALDGFYLNDRRLQLFGLNRHELYPYLGFAAPNRLLRRDADILRHQFNVNIVRCSHYPQSEAFLDACDELGLLVWEELPGWQYIGDDAFCKLAIRDVEQMIRRDRNHPAIAIWGVRINESHNDPELYRQTRALAHSLDNSRPTSGTMTPDSRKNWQQEWAQDVFAFDDYHADPVGKVGILEPVEGFPYMIAETVGQYDYRKGRYFDVTYRRAGDLTQQTDQAIFHAQAHSRTAENPRIAGAIAWCAFDYASLINAHNAIKCPGIADVFRIPKLGASFYLAQCDPAVRPIIEPDFYWDFGPKTPSGPGEHAAIFSNCDRLELFLDSKHHATLRPDRANYPHLKHAPFFTDLKLAGTGHPELRIDGYVGSNRVLSRSFSSDASADQLLLKAEDAELEADGSDATRLAFAVVDRHGAPRAFATGQVSLQIEGPGEIVGDNPFSVDDNGGAGAVFIRSVPGRTGVIRVEARHSALGAKSVSIRVQPAASGRREL
jgi:beta-galactosidase